MTFEGSIQHENWRAQRRRRERNRERSPLTGVIIGSLVAFWGLALLLDNLGLGDVRHYIQRAWPAALVILGISLLIRRDEQKNHYAFWGWVWLLAGATIYALQQNLIHAFFGEALVPLVIVAFGASFVYRGFKKQRRQEQPSQSR